MPATIHFSMPLPAKTKPATARREYSLEELMHRIAANGDRPAKPKPKPVLIRRELPMEELLRRLSTAGERPAVRSNAGGFRLLPRGRPLTRLEKGLMLLMTGGLGFAIWLQVQPAPVSAHTAYYQSIAAATRLEATAPMAFTASALRTIGTDWRAASLFACVHPSFWRSGPAVHPDVRATRIERGLTRLAEHGSVVSVMTFTAPLSVETQTVDGVDMLAAQIAGQLELADGTVVRFAARLVQDESSRRWGLAHLAIPGFLP